MGSLTFGGPLIYRFLRLGDPLTSEYPPLLGSPFHFISSQGLQISYRALFGDPLAFSPHLSRPLGSKSSTDATFDSPSGPSHPRVPRPNPRRSHFLPPLPPPTSSPADPLPAAGRSSRLAAAPVSPLTSKATPRFSRFFLVMLLDGFPKSLLDAPTGGATHVQSLVLLPHWPPRWREAGLLAVAI